MQPRRKIAVAGATGQIGRHVVAVLEARGHDVVAMSRSSGVDLVSGDGLAAGLAGVECIVDVVNAGTLDQEAATRFFTTAARNLQETGARAGVQRLVVLSIIGCDRFTTGYMAAKAAQEQAALAGPIPARILRAAQFHEFVGQAVGWGQQGAVSHVPRMRTQLVNIRCVAEALADLATGADAAPAAGGPGATIPEVAGPRPEELVDAAQRLVARRGDALQIEGTEFAAGPDQGLAEGGALLPGPHATLVGPTFDEWLEQTFGSRAGGTVHR